MSVQTAKRRRSKPQTGRNYKLECPTCEMVLRVSRGAIIRHGMPSCGCGSRFFFSELQVQLEVVPEIRHEHPDYKAASELERRREMRESRNQVLVPNQMRCGGCNAWIRSANERHSCGFHNDVRGNRNHGRWVTGTSRVSAAMAF